MTAPFSVTTECPILIGIFNGFSWIRCEGKGSFLNSPLLKEFGAARMDAGETCLVIDLGACTGMDSTFMGTLAGMASRLSATAGGVVQIADAAERNRRSLEDLGLDFLLQIDPQDAVWLSSIDTIRADLKPPQPAAPQSLVQRTQLVLDAHRVLSEANEKNTATFSTVVSLLEAELTEKQAKEPMSTGN